MPQSSPESLVGHLAGYDRLVEVGIGQNPAVARRLVARGATVTATDVHDRSVPREVSFVIDDVTDPDPSVYEAADAIYALRLPPELQRPAWDLAETIGVPLYFTTLGGEPTLVPVERRTLPEGTLFVATR